MLQGKHAQRLFDALANNFPYFFLRTSTSPFFSFSFFYYGTKI